MAEHEAASRRPWLRPWLVVGLAAWAQVGVTLVDRAQRQGLVEDISFSPYHLVGYAALLTLAAYVGWTYLRSLRRGWRTAFPPMYGGLAIAFLLLVGWVVLDIVWRNTLGINDNIEGGLAPTRLLIPAALALLAIGPVRAAIADRARPGLSAGERRARWAGVVGAALVGGALTQVAFNPVRDPLNDVSLNPGVDASEIWTMTPTGAGQTRVLAALGDGVDFSLPAWSPDGQRIAYTVWTNKGGVPQNQRLDDQTTAIWTMAADGSDRRLVFGTQPDQAWIPAWSPDGQWIAYTLSPFATGQGAAPQPEANPGPGQVGPPTRSAGASIWIVHPDGSGNTRLTDEGLNALNLVWAPNGKTVAYIAESGGRTNVVVATLADGKLSDQHRIATSDADDWGPAWSPDGTRIAFASNRSGNDDIWVAPIDGGEPMQLTSDPAGDWVPVFSPDGKWIAFTSDRSGEPEVWRMAVDGTGPADVTQHPGHYDGQWSVAWAPDGDRLAYATGSFQDAAGSGWVREDLAAAQALFFGLALAIVALLVVALGAPFGSFTVAALVIVAISALASDQWRFLPAALVAGLITDVLVRSARLRHRARVAAAALPALASLAIGLTIGAGGGLAWSLTLLLGVAVASGLVGWALADAVERLFPRPTPAHEAPSA